MDESGQDVDAKRRRAKHSKTRKGCARCKQRHIKCDEERPSCNRCTQAGLSCPGYDHALTRSKRGPVKRFRIIQGHTITLAPAVKHHVSPIALPVLPERPRATPDREQAAIDFFLQRTMSTLSKYVPQTQLWTEEVFQGLLMDAKIRNIVIAIGLAHQDMLDNIARGVGPYTTSVQAERSGSVSPPEAAEADRYYNASLAFMRIDISTVRENATAERTDVAAACLLIVIYLSLHNRMDEAGVHMTCGLEVVSEGGSGFISSSKVNQEIYLLFLHFSTASWPSHPSAPLYDVMQSTIKLSCYLDDLDLLSSLRLSLDLCAQRIYAYTSQVTRGTFPSTKSTTAARSALISELDLLTDQIEQYAEAIGTSSSMKDAFVFAMKARINLYRIFTQAVSTRYQTTYDRYTQLFHDAVNLIWQAAQRGSPVVGPDWPLISIHLNVIGTLRQMNLLCRHPAIRRRSLNMLKYVPQREGIVEAGEGFQLGNIAIDFEESGLSLDPLAKFTVPVPEENRLHFIESIRRAQLQSVVLEDDEIMVRLMYRPDGDSSYVERRVKTKKEHYDLRYQKVIDF